MTNERELLAIVWALDTLRHYLYGKSDINIYSDHQPLIFAVSCRNPNSKIKRWKARVEDSGARVLYKPGKDNHVADALSRHTINALDNSVQCDAATMHSEASLTYTIEATDRPLNCFMNQIVLEESNTPSKQFYLIFREKTRHILGFDSHENLFEILKDVVKPEVVNAIHCDLPMLARIQDKLVKAFPSTKFWHCKSWVTDITNDEECKEIISAEHNRAHRAAQENVKQVLRDSYFPKNWQNSIRSSWEL